jgi:hypothetical protein
VEAEPPLLDQGGPKDRQLLALRIKQGAGHRRRAVRLAPTADTLVEGDVLLADAYRHARSVMRSVGRPW